MNTSKLLNAREIINQAQVSHFALGLQLRAAAYDDNPNINVRAFRRNDNCELARLIADLKAKDAMTDRAKQVEMLHNDLHDAAGAVAALIKAGQFDQAIAEVATGYFADASTALAKSLCYFKNEF